METPTHWPEWLREIFATVRIEVTDKAVIIKPTIDTAHESGGTRIPPRRFKQWATSRSEWITGCAYSLGDMVMMSTLEWRWPWLGRILGDLPFDSETRKARLFRKMHLAVFRKTRWRVTDIG